MARDSVPVGGRQRGGPGHAGPGGRPRHRRGARVELSAPPLRGVPILRSPARPGAGRDGAPDGRPRTAGPRAGRGGGHAPRSAAPLRGHVRVGRPAGLRARALHEHRRPRRAARAPARRAGLGCPQVGRRHRAPLRAGDELFGGQPRRRRRDADPPAHRARPLRRGRARRHHFGRQLSDHVAGPLGSRSHPGPDRPAAPGGPPMPRHRRGRRPPRPRDRGTRLPGRSQRGRSGDGAGAATRGGGRPSGRGTSTPARGRRLPPYLRGRHRDVRRRAGDRRQAGPPDPGRAARARHA